MSERAVFDVRVWVEGDSAADVYDAIAEYVRLSRRLDIDGVHVRYSQLRTRNRSRKFTATMTGKRRDGGIA